MDLGPMGPSHFSGWGGGLATASGGKECLRMPTEAAHNDEQSWPKAKQFKDLAL